MAEKTLPVYLSLEQAAEVMSLSVKTIRRRIADRGLANVLESCAIRLLSQARRMRERHDHIQGAQAVRLREELR